VGGGFACGSQNIQAAARTILASGNLRVFPVTLKQAHRFKAAQRTIQRAVRSQKTAITVVTKALGYFVAVEFGGAAAAQLGGAHADGGFKRKQLAGLSSHRPTIRRYMLIVNAALSRTSVREPDR
jgi:hypothetical protein